MLEHSHSPPLPLTVDSIRLDGITKEDEEGILLALEQSDRVLHLPLAFPVQNLRERVIAIDGEFPILEYLVVAPSTDDSTALMPPDNTSSTKSTSTASQRQSR